MTAQRSETAERETTVSATEATARAALLAGIAGAREQPSVANVVVRGGDLLTGAPFAIDFEQDVAREVVADVIDHARVLSERELLPYDPSYQPSTGQALFDDVANVPELAVLHKRVLAGDPPIDVPPRGGQVVPVAGLVHRVEGVDGPPITAYRFKGPGIATRRPSGLRILVPRNGVWMRVADELLYYQPRFDAIVVDDVVLVTAPTTLQRTLGSDTRAKRMARDTFGSATSSIAIEGRADLADAVSTDPAMIAKMAQLSRTLDADPGYADFLTTDRLLRFLDENPQVEIRTAGAGSTRHLVFEPSPQTRYLIPKMLADDFLRSELTSRRYEAGSKHRIDN